MRLVKGLGLVILAVVAIAIGYSVLALIGDKGAAVSVEVKALPQTKIAGYVMPSKAAVNYSELTIRQLKTAARGTGIKSWEKLRKAELVTALTAI